MDGELRTSLPGTPLFPSLGDGSILQPTLNWKLHSGTKADLDAQLSYLTRGMSWRADYNLVLPEDGDDVVMTGLISLTNNTGKVFEDAKIKLIAGDVNRVPEYQEMAGYGRNMMMARAAVADAAPQVEEKKFDEFHMYTLPLPTTLFDQETKQVEFIRSQDVHSKRVLVYDGSQAGANTLHYRGSSPISAPDYGVESNTSVATYREFKNSEANGLGSALPAGKLRFYRTDSDGQLEFVGENTIKHTPKDETVRVYLGNAFDLVGQRTRTEFVKHPTQNQIRETFSIELRNRGDKQADVQILEHLYRWSNWTITHASDQFKQLDSDTVEFPVSLAPGETRTVNYTVQYTW